MSELGMQLSSAERQGWEDFCQRLGACLRAGTLVRVLDDCRDLKLSEACAKSSNELLNSELTILVLHRRRNELPS